MAWRNHLPSSLFLPTVQILVALGPGCCPWESHRVTLNWEASVCLPAVGPHSGTWAEGSHSALSDPKFLFVSTTEERVAYEIDRDLWVNLYLEIPVSKTFRSLELVRFPRPFSKWSSTGSSIFPIEFYGVLSSSCSATSVSQSTVSVRNI